MSAVTEIHTGGIKQFYDKILLVALLVALLVSAAILWFKIQQSKELLATSGEAVMPSEEQTVAPVDEAQMLAQMERLREPFQIPPRSQRMFVSEIRYACQKCGKPVPMLEKKCPFCGFEDEGVVDPTRRDSDGDGMPDWWEEKYELNPFNPDDATLDSDGDGFTNYEEFLAGTDPRNPASFPDLPIKLRIAEPPRREPLQVQFLAVQEIIEGQKSYQLNLRDRTYFAKVGDRVGGFEIVGYDEANDALIVRQGQRQRTLKRGVGAMDEDYIVKFLLLVDGSRFDVKVGTEFKLRGAAYRFVELMADGRARVVAVESGKEYLVPAVDPRELEIRLNDPSRGIGPEGIQSEIFAPTPPLRR